LDEVRVRREIKTCLKARERSEKKTAEHDDELEPRGALSSETHT
jgi:hypothetical protein